MEETPSEKEEEDNMDITQPENELKENPLSITGLGRD